MEAKPTISEEMRRRARLWLAEAGLRPTRQRVVLAALLVGDGQDRHVTADWLHAAARSAGEPVALATVYNALHCFRDAGLVNEIRVEGTRTWFDTRTEPHLHFYWEKDGQLDDGPDAAVDVRNLPEPPPGAEISRVDVVVRLRRRGPGRQA